MDAGAVECDLREALIPGDGSIVTLLEVLQEMRADDGDLIAHDYREHMESGAVSMDEAAASLIDCYGAPRKP